MRETLTQLYNGNSQAARTFTDMWGRLISILIMIAGGWLFLKLVQALFRPVKVNYERHLRADAPRSRWRPLQALRLGSAYRR